VVQPLEAVSDQSTDVSVGIASFLDKNIIANGHGYNAGADVERHTCKLRMLMRTLSQTLTLMLTLTLSLI